MIAISLIETWALCYYVVKMLNLLNGSTQLFFFFTFSFFIKDFKFSAPNKQMNTTLRQIFTLILDVL